MAVGPTVTVSPDGVPLMQGLVRVRGVRFQCVWQKGQADLLVAEAGYTAGSRWIGRHGG